MSIRVKMLRTISGTRNGAAYPPPGEVMELGPDDTGEDLTRNGYAELVREPVIERAVRTIPEKAAERTPKPQTKARRSSRPAKEG